MCHVYGFICYMCVELKLMINTRSLSNQALKSAHPSLLSSRCWPWGVFIGAGQPLQHGEVRDTNLAWVRPVPWLDTIGSSGQSHTCVTNKSAQGRLVVSADRIRNEHILSMRSVTNGKSQSCWLAPLSWWGWLWINSTASGWPHNRAKCYVIFCYTDCLFCALNKVINTWPASHIEHIKSVLMLNMLTNRPMENSAVKISNAYS